ncbi:hypothetical protein LSAT2_008121 [Lamellibrachia satsuma]|nr:hypothetical protein LSAT2_008121 [Lamellibrachia satsuma]
MTTRRTTADLKQMDWLYVGMLFNVLSLRECKAPQGTACESNPCLSRGHCVALEAAYYCDCQTGITGKNCEDNACKTHFCLNGGTCHISRAVGGVPSCSCKKHFTGMNCNTAKTSCWSSPCLNSGKCISTSTDQYECKCTPTFYGGRCQKQSRIKHTNAFISTRSAYIAGISVSVAIVAFAVVVYIVNRRSQTGVPCNDESGDNSNEEPHIVDHVINAMWGISPTSSTSQVTPPAATKAKNSQPLPAIEKVKRDLRTIVTEDKPDTRKSRNRRMSTFSRKSSKSTKSGKLGMTHNVRTKSQQYPKRRFFELLVNDLCPYPIRFGLPFYEN